MEKSPFNSVVSPDDAKAVFELHAFYTVCLLPQFNQFRNSQKMGVAFKINKTAHDSIHTSVKHLEILQKTILLAKPLP